MQKFTEKIVSMMKAENLFETQGGPIILSQVEKFDWIILCHSSRSGFEIVFLNMDFSFLRH